VHLLVRDECGEDVGGDVDENADGFGGAAKPTGKAALEWGFILHGDCVVLRCFDRGGGGGLLLWDGDWDGLVG
jgi:hypothetical protein